MQQAKTVRKEKQMQKRCFVDKSIEWSEKNKELFQLANIDSLTKIRNRRNYFIESSNLLEKAILNNQSLDVAIIDIDDFKKINDTMGHHIGDFFIEFASKRLKESVNENDFLFPSDER